MDEKTLQRFLNFIKIDKHTGCWLWLGSTMGGKYRYGCFKLKGKKAYAHRVSYQHFNEPIKNNNQVCHACDTPLCVNPDHLWQGTKSDNMKDMVHKGRYGKPTYNIVGEENSQSKLKEFQVKEIRQKYNTNTYTQMRLAEEYNVSKSLIYYVVNNKRWKHLL